MGGSLGSAPPPSESSSDEEPETPAYKPVPHKRRFNGGFEVLCNASAVDFRYHDELDRSLSDDYEVSTEVLGKGLCGNVVVVHGKRDHRRYAMKTLFTTGVVSEVEMHLRTDHPNIVRIMDIFESGDKICLVTECCEGGTLQSALQDAGGTYRSIAAAELTRQILHAVHHLHSRRIVHRDLNLENLVFQGKGANMQMDAFLQQMEDPWSVGALREFNAQKSYGERSVNIDDIDEETPHSPLRSRKVDAPQLKLIDFHFAGTWEPGKPMMGEIGTVPYVSPDVLTGAGYTYKCDLWSIGVIIWMLLIGKHPFSEAPMKMMSEIQAAEIDWNCWDRAEELEDAKDLARRLLVKNPKQRLGANGALLQRWLTDTMPEARLQPSFAVPVRAMQSYAAGSILRRAALIVLVQQLDWQETRQLRASFVDMDQGDNGFITLDDVKSAMQHLEHHGIEANSFERPEALFTALDSDGTKRICYVKFMAVTLKVCPHLHSNALEATFARLDANGDGSISIDDLRKTLGKSFEGMDIAEVLREALPGHGMKGDALSKDVFFETMTFSSYQEGVRRQSSRRLTLSTEDAMVPRRSISHATDDALPMSPRSSKKRLTRRGSFS